MNKTGILAGICIFTGFATIVAYASIVSGNFSHDPSVINRGGEASTDGANDNLGVIDEGATGIATSPNFKSFAGFLYVLPHEPVRLISPPSPGVLGTGGSASFQWVSDWSGSWTLTAGGNVVASGSCAAGVPETTQVAEGVLADDSINSLTLAVSSPPNQAGLNIDIVDDQTPPVFSAVQMTTVSGRVEDLSITQLTVTAGGQTQEVPVTGGTFAFTCPAGTTDAVIEGGGFRKTVRVGN